MSVIAVRKYSDRIEFAADSISVSKGFIKRVAESSLSKGSDNDKNLIMDNVKLFESPDQGLVIGSVGWVMQTTFLQMYSKYHKPKGIDLDDILEYICDFYAWAKSKDSSFAEIGNEYIICFENQLFKITDRYLVEKIPEYDAIGVGEPFALTALSLGKSPKEAVQVANKLCLYCCDPVHELTKLI